MTTMAGRFSTARRALTRAEWARLGGLTGIVAGLHLVGFGVLLLVVAPRYGAVIGLGVGLTAYGFGLRHAFDADHIAAIDNTTRKLLADGKRPMGVGFFFSLGHSTIVFGLSFLLAIAARSVQGAITDERSQLHNLGGYIGTSVSGLFLYIIAGINLVILVGIVRIFREMHRGHYDEVTLEKRLNERGFMNRLLGPLARSIRHSWQMYPIGVLFGLGFDTATEVGLLALAATAGGADLPWYAILCLPVLFAAGMSMMDTADGVFMSVAYGWAFSKPVRKVFYNLTITGLSVVVALLVGTVELVALAGSYLGHRGDTSGFWGFLNAIDLNSIGFLIVGLFVVTWVLAMSIWAFFRVEERWTVSAAAARASGTGPGRSVRARKSLIVATAQTWLTTQAAIVAMVVMYMVINRFLVDGHVGGDSHNLVVLVVALAIVAVGVAIARLAIAIDGRQSLVAFSGLVVLELIFLVAGILTAHHYPGLVPFLEITVPVGGILLLLAPQTAVHAWRAARERPMEPG